MKAKFKVTKSLMSILLCLALVLTYLPVLSITAFAAGTTAILALGDSITTGYGLNKSVDPPEQSFTELLAATDGYTVTNKAVDGNTAAGLLAQLDGTDTNNPITEADVKAADVVTITIGGNDLMALLYQAIATQYNNNQADQANHITAADVPEIFSNSSDSRQMSLMNYAMGLLNPESDIYLIDDPEFANAVAALIAALNQITANILGKNSNVTIIVATQYNPYVEFNGAQFTFILPVDLTPIYLGMENGISAMNTAIVNNAETGGYIVADVKAALDAYTGTEDLYQAAPDSLNVDFHPKAAGHALIAETMAAVIDSIADAHSHPLCGAAHTDVGDHTGDCQPVEWMPWTGVDEDTSSTSTIDIKTGGNYYLTETTVLENTILFGNSSGAAITVNLCLNGQELNLNATNLNYLAVENAILNICDCGGTGKITNYSGNFSSIRLSAGAVLNLYSGSITGNSVPYGGVHVNSSAAAFNMYGGTISDNTSNSYGGGVHVYAGDFHMYGGTISGNKSSYYGGGVYASSDADVIIDDGALIQNNTAEYGGGVYVGTTVDLTVNGGSITGNTATINGGGVLITENSSVVSINGGTITGNTVDNAANNVYLPSGKTIAVETMTTGASIGVTMSTPGTFTTGGAAYADNFTSDDPVYGVVPDGDNLMLEDLTPKYWTDPGNYDISWYDPDAYVYTINDGADLAGLAVLVNGMNGETATSFLYKTINLGDDIDLSAYYWKPIGNDTAHTFDGSFNGSNKTITGMKVRETNAGTNGVGLFGCSSGMIRDLTVTDSSVRSDGWHTGGIVGFLSSTTILNCSYSGSVSGLSIVGGLVGTSYNSSITKCTNYAAVAADGSDGKAGGIVGDNMGWVNNCGNFGEISGIHLVGGIAGYMSSGPSIKNSFSVGKVTAEDLYVGGIVPYEYQCTVSNCYYLDTSCDVGIYSGSEAAKAGAIAKDSAAFASGEVAYLLNGSVSGGTTWYQNLDNGEPKDDYPVFSGGKVYRSTTYQNCDMSDSAPVVAYSNTNSGDVVPPHEYQYVGENAVITETCKNCDTHTETATIVIDASAELVYAPNTAHEPATVEYSEGWQGGELAIDYENNENAGTDMATASIEIGDAKATLAFSILQATNEWTIAPSISGWTYGESASTPRGEAKFGDVTVYYTGTTNAGDPYNSADAPAEAGAYAAAFTVEETTNYSDLSETVNFTIAKADQTAPTELDADNETIYGKADGKITGLTTAMEISTEEDGTYTRVTDPDMTFAAGTYYVRYAADDNHNASPAAPMEIDQGRKLTVTILPATQTGYTLSADKTELDWQDDLIITFSLNEGYSETDDFEITINGEKVTLTNGQYTVAAAETDIAIEVTGVADITAPEGEITIRTVSWKEFISNVSFGLFFKDEVDVTITASDAGSGIAAVEYLLSETGFASADAVTGDWNKLTESNGRYTFSIQANQKAYVYVRISDNDGNITILNSDGVVVYTNPQAEAAISFTKATTEDVVAEVEMNGNTVKAIYNGTELIDSGSYTVDYAADTISFKADYLQSLENGNYTLRVVYDPLGEEYADPDVNEEPGETSIALRVGRQTGSVEITNDIGKVYNGEAVSDVTFERTNTEGAVTVEYKPADADDTAYTTEAPKTAGDYIVRVSVAEDAAGNYTDASDTAEFTIEPRQLTADVVVVTEKIYDTHTRAIVRQCEITNKVEGDDILLVASAAYDSPDIATHKTITVTFALSGEDAGNYIAPAAYTIENAVIAKVPEHLEGISPDSLQKVEEVERQINALPDPITEADADEVKAAIDAYDALSNYEKHIFDPDVKAKLGKAFRQLADLSMSGSTGENVDRENEYLPSPPTGDTADLQLWFIVLFLSSTILLAASVYCRKRKTED